MGKTAILVVLLIGAGAACGCAQLGLVYHKGSQQWSFRPPSGWRHVQHPIEQATMFQSHHVRDFEFRPELKVVVSETEIETVEELMEEFTEETQELPEYELVEEDTVGNFDGRRLVYSYYDPDYKITMMAVTQLLLTGGKVYKATCVAPASLWKRYKRMFYNSLDTFEFGEK